MAIPRNEYPRPQFVRDEWLCLNGAWQFEIDRGDSGLERGVLERELSDRILVPFCPESKLSGIGNTDFLNAVWYRREVEVPAAWSGRRVLLHFQAVDDESTVWMDGVEAAWHRGGWTPFQVDLGEVAGRTITIVVRARDDHRERKPAGKQSRAYHNAGCHYTRTTGIWQSVWMEPVPAVALARPRVTPDVGRGAFRLTMPLDLGSPRPSVGGYRVRASLRDGQGVVCEAESRVADLSPGVELVMPPDRVRLWSMTDPFLYDIELSLIDASGQVVDRASSYAGLRSVQLDGNRVLLNGESVFQRLVLDQGYYPDGIMTAPDDAALKRDIELSMAAGFNGARLHQKVFEERFLYHADRLGYLCWGEYGDWGMLEESRMEEMIHGWTEAMMRDYSHPCIVGWCPLNESRHFRDPVEARLAGLMRTLFVVTKAIDPSRPVVDVSGGFHCVPETDVIDTHDYEQNMEPFAANHEKLSDGKLREWWARPPFDPPAIAGRPFFVSEFGGIWWNPDAAANEPSWGYGERPKSIEKFYERFDDLCRVLLEHPAIFGYCYTQLTDVYQEQNGIYGFDRREKFDMARIRASQQRKAAIEQ